MNKIDEVIAVSGSSNLYKMAVNKSSGLVLEDMSTGKKRFFSARKHQFTPLGSIAIYTVDDSRPLQEVFEMMQAAEIDFQPPSHKAEPQEIIEYFEEVMPDYDPEQVNPGDIRKVLKWYNFLTEHNFFQNAEESPSDNLEEEEE
ncbi:MAG TPA: DUF5606 domain-containing protein [Saprospiraceae bacterium]|nr:DUF5606 domain-containing protein [Saprospiraceae bacterium]